MPWITRLEKRRWLYTYCLAVSLPAVFDVKDVDNLPDEVNLQDNAPIPHPQAPLARLHLYLAKLGIFRLIRI
jgi:hypothetical protein